MSKPCNNCDGEVQDFETLESEAKELINAAIEARNYSYSPYSNFKVGAAIRTGSGAIKTGCNIENGAYGPSICAERTAATKAISEGNRVFRAVAVVAHQESSFTTPCGVCRQFLAEFVHSDIPVYVTRPGRGKVLITSIHSLLPMGFIPMKREEDNNFQLSKL